MQPTKTMRKRWDPIPRGICSLPVVSKKELGEHFRMIQRRGLHVFRCPVRIPANWPRDHKKTARQHLIQRAIEQIELICVKGGFLLADDIIVISRVRGGFVVWGIGYPVVRR